jgi:competence ComEA-like helix-hairpin-helix protein
MQPLEPGVRRPFCRRNRGILLRFQPAPSGTGDRVVSRLSPAAQELPLVPARQVVFELGTHPIEKEEKRMKPKRLLVCLAAFLLLIVWTSPVAFAQAVAPEKSKSVNINTASMEDLVQLPRVGEKVAERIIEYRQKNGPFKTIEDLKAVNGIGDKNFDQIRHMITVK